MDCFQVEFSKRAQKEFRKIDTRYIPKIYASIENLQTDPRPIGCKKLSGSEYTYRIRIGDYRVIYEIEDGQLIVLIVKIRHRQSAYD